LDISQNITSHGTYLWYHWCGLISFAPSHITSDHHLIYRARTIIVIRQPTRKQRFKKPSNNVLLHDVDAHPSHLFTLVTLLILAFQCCPPSSALRRQLAPPARASMGVRASHTLVHIKRHDTTEDNWRCSQLIDNRSSFANCGVRIIRQYSVSHSLAKKEEG
jgi:hypothetical protein